MLGAGGDEDGVPLAKLDLLTLDFERASAFEDDVHLVVGVRALVVGLRRDQHVDADLEARRGVDDLVAAAGRLEPPPDPIHLERVHRATTLAGTAGTAAFTFANGTGYAEDVLVREHDVMVFGSAVNAESDPAFISITGIGIARYWK